MTRNAVYGICVMLQDTCMRCLHTCCDGHVMTRDMLCYSVAEHECLQACARPMLHIGDGCAALSSSVLYVWLAVLLDA